MASKQCLDFGFFNPISKEDGKNDIQKIFAISAERLEKEYAMPKKEIF